MRLLRPAILGLLWAAVAVYILWAGLSARRDRSAQRVRSLEIEIVDSTSQGYLVTGAQARRWISQSGIGTVGTAVGEVDLTGLERLIARNGFVEEVAAYIRGGGELHLRITPREPLLRLLTDGRNAYVTREGYVFGAPRASSLYVPVVTGSYRPPFPADYTGDVRAYIDRRKQELDERIAELERTKYPVYRREQANDRAYGSSAASESSVGGGRARARRCSTKGSRRCGTKRPRNGAATGIGAGSSRRNSTGLLRSRRRSA